MEKQNIFPEIDLLPRLTKVAEFVKTVLRAGHVTEPSLSNHIRNEE